VAHPEDDTFVGVFAAGAHAAALQHLRAVPGRGVIGWVAANQRPAVNAEPALDLGYEAPTLTPPLRAALAVPLISAGRVEAVLSVYAAEPGVYSEDHAQVLEVMAPILAGVLASVAGSRNERREPAPVPSLRLVTPRQPPMPRVRVG
jgi:signal transduction protein with GAF and PtsI domain